MVAGAVANVTVSDEAEVARMILAGVKVIFSEIGVIVRFPK